MLSRGQPSGSANQVYMRPHPLDRSATIAQLVADRHRFTPQPCIDGDRIILHLGMSASEKLEIHSNIDRCYSCLTASSCSSHRSLSTSVPWKAAFPHDGYSMAANPNSFEDDCQSDDGNQSGDDSDDPEEVGSLLASIQSRSGQRIHNTARNEPAAVSLCLILLDTAHHSLIYSCCLLNLRLLLARAPEPRRGLLAVGLLQ